ncbi:MAG: hypothetical protein N2C12_15710, partial [Planctomycetales bacterium]
TFAVTVPQLEDNEAWLNEPVLMNLAAESGGNYFHLDELDELLEMIPSEKTKQFRVHLPPRPLWDNSHILFLLVGMLCVEWAVRKKYRLI